MLLVARSGEARKLIMTVQVVVTAVKPKITEVPKLKQKKTGSNRWNAIHEEIQGRKREAELCPGVFQACPSSCLVDVAQRIVLVDLVVAMPPQIVTS